jgi:hypothetical protein
MAQKVGIESAAVLPERPSSEEAPPRIEED